MAEALKDSYNTSYIERLANGLKREYDQFDTEAFVEHIFDDNWQQRELKSRAQHIRTMLHRFIDLPFKQSAELLCRVAPEFTGYEALFFPDYIASYGLDEWEYSLDTLAYLTRFSSSEFAVRPFIEQDPERMMAQMLAWSGDANHHVRRLASEGCRPRLPWGSALTVFKTDPSPIIPILNNLKSDESLYVRRSVANNLNDISKDNPQVMIDWARLNIGQTDNCDWVIKHACRSLLKKAEPQVMELFGYHPVDDLSVDELQLRQSRITIGDKLQFSFQLNSKQKLGRIRVEYEIDYLKANGLHSSKVFKLFEGDSESDCKAFNTKQSFRQMTTRKHYPGIHHLYIRVNGERLAEEEFMLVE